MRPVVWRPQAEPSPAEQAVIKAVRRAKLFVFLRLHRDGGREPIGAIRTEMQQAVEAGWMPAPGHAYLLSLARNPLQPQARAIFQPERFAAAGAAAKPGRRQVLLRRIYIPASSRPSR